MQPGEEKALGRAGSSVLVLKRGTRRVDRDYWQGHVVVGQGTMGLGGRRAV